MEKKPNITPTPWRISTAGQTNEGQKAIVTEDGRIGLVDVQDVNIKPRQRYNCEDEQRDANAQAIVTAVNCTYGANINPEKIQELIDVSDKIKALADADGEMILSQEMPLYKQLQEALNNIKYKD